MLSQVPTLPNHSYLIRKPASTAAQNADMTQYDSFQLSSDPRVILIAIQYIRPDWSSFVLIVLALSDRHAERHADFAAV